MSWREKLGRWLCSIGLHKWRPLPYPVFGTIPESSFDVYCAREHCDEWLGD